MERPRPGDVRLRPLREDEYPAWTEASGEFYVRDLVAHAGMDEQAARRKLEADRAAVLPRGKDVS